MNVSPGCSRAKNTAWLAWAPECGWTLAKPQSNSFLARSMASGLGLVDVSRSRRSSAGRDSPRRICWSAPSPALPARRAETMFSEAISSIPSCCRASSPSDRGGELGVGFGERGGEEAGGAGGGVACRFIGVMDPGRDGRAARAWRRGGRAGRPRRGWRGRRGARPAPPPARPGGRPSAATLASLCARVSRAAVLSCSTAARMPRWRLAAMAMPMPVPQTRTPSGRGRLRRPAQTRSAEVGVVDRRRR